MFFLPLSRYWYFLLWFRHLKTCSGVVEDDIAALPLHMDNQAIPNAIHIGNRQADDRRLGKVTRKSCRSVVFRVLHASLRRFNDNHLATQDKGKKRGRAAMSYVCLHSGDTRCPILPLVFYSLPPGNDKRVPQNIQAKETEHPDTNKDEKMRAAACAQWLSIH